MLRDIEFGKIDAKNELLSDNEQEHDAFINGFEIPPNVKIDDFTTGKKFIAYGMKGSGKTALLRYIGINAARESNDHSLCVLFKSEFTNEEKKNLWRFKNISATDSSTNSDDYKDDFEDVWRWFLYRKVAEYIQENLCSIIEKNEDFEKFAEVVTSPVKENSGSGISRLFPKLKRGCVEISSIPSLKVEFDWENKSQNQVKFSRLVSQADNLFNKLKSGSNSLFVLLDELELNNRNKDVYEKDALLIRDLIVACEKLNRICRQNDINIYFIASVRSEVIRNVKSLGKEINKTISDFGCAVFWHINQSKGVHPLIKIICNRLRYYECKTFGTCEDSDEQLFGRYFPEKTGDKDTKKILLDRTWCRPRDIVRLLNVAKGLFPNEVTFNPTVLQNIRHDYSQESWIEISEELLVKYSADDISAIEKNLRGMHTPFWYREFCEQIDVKSSMFPNVKILKEKYHVTTILEDLFRIGVIGNIAKNEQGGIPKFFFRGEADIDFEREMILHNALAKHFNFVKRSEKFKEGA